MEAPEKTDGTPSNRTQRLAGTVDWGTPTAIGVLVGWFYEGSKEANASAKKDAELALKLGINPDKREVNRFWRDAMKRAFIRITRASIAGGVRVGMFTAGFYGLQNFLAEKRGVRDVFNAVGAGSATFAAFGLMMPGPLHWRARNVVLGSVLGAALGFPLGWIHLKLVEKVNEGNTGAKELGEMAGARSGLGAAIELLEENLNK